MALTLATGYSVSDPDMGVDGFIHSDPAEPFTTEKPEKKDAEHTRETDFPALLLHICGEKPATVGAAEWISGIIAEIDRRISAQINQILHHEAFQKLEGTWRGLYYLVSQSPESHDIRIRVLNLSFRDASRCLKKYPGTTWDQSPIFKLIYEYEFGTAGGEPFGCLIGDYYFDESPSCMEMLEGVSRIASAAHVPFIAGLSPRFMNLESWQELENPCDYNRILNVPEYTQWRRLRDNPDSRYVALTLPRVLARVPYGCRSQSVSDMDFEENVGAGIPGNFCWMNAAYVMGRNVIRAYEKYGWCVRICNAEGGGYADQISPLPSADLNDESPVFMPLETALTDQREQELSKNGFLVLSSLKNDRGGVFQHGQTLYRPKVFSTTEATRNEALSSQLPCVFAVSRFAHYIKCIMRDKIGGFPNMAEAEKWLNDWLSNYVSGDPDASDEIKAKYPMSEARVVFTKRPENPGCYEVMIFLRPHYQIDGLTAAVKLTAQTLERENT